MNEILQFSTDESCIICLEHITENDPAFYNGEIPNIYNIKCQCRPKIHKTCMTDWINHEHTCPICSKNIVSDSLHVNELNTNDTPQDVIPSNNSNSLIPRISNYINQFAYFMFFYILFILFMYYIMDVL